MAFVFLAGAAHGATDTWTGANSSTDSNWSDALNWNAAVPGTVGTTTNTDIAIFTGTPASLLPVLDASYNLQSINFGNGASASAFTLSGAPGVSLLLSSGGAITDSDQQVTGLDYQTVSANIVIENSSGTALGSGNYAFTSSGASTDSTHNNFLVISGNVAGSASTGNTTTLMLNGGENTRGQGSTNAVNGIISDGANGGALALKVQYDGSGSTQWILGGANTYTGGTSVGTSGFAGTLQVGNGTGTGYATGATPLGNGGTVNISNNTVDFNTSTGGGTIYRTTFNNAFNLTGGSLVNVDGNNILAGNITVGNGDSVNILTDNNNKIFNFNGLMSGSGTLNLNGVSSGFGPQSVAFTGAGSTYTGTIKVTGNDDNNGVQALIGANTALQDAAIVLSAPITNTQSQYGATAVGSSILFAGTGTATSNVFGTATTSVTAPVIGSLAGSGNFALETLDTTPLGVALTTGGNNTSTTYSGVISDGSANTTPADGSLTKTGTGTFTVSGANTYAGGTTINEGVFSAVNASGSATGTGAVSVTALSSSNYGTLSGGNSGTLTTLGTGSHVGSLQTYTAGAGSIGGPVTLNQYGHLDPGVSAIGTIAMIALTLDAGSVLDYEFSSTANDFTVVSGTNGLTITGGGFNLYQVGTTTAFSTIGVYNLFSYTGTLGGNVNNLSVLNGTGMTYTFVNDTTDDLVQLDVTAAPEPSVWALMLGGLVVLISVRKFTGRREKFEA